MGRELCQTSKPCVHGPWCMRVGIPGVFTVCASGCFCADAKGKFDELVEAKGVRILIEPAALMHVLGTKMDFLEDKLK